MCVCVRVCVCGGCIHVCVCVCVCVCYFPPTVLQKGPMAAWEIVRYVFKILGCSHQQLDVDLVVQFLERKLPRTFLSQRRDYKGVLGLLRTC